MNHNIENIVSSIRSVFVKSAAEKEIEESIRELKGYSDSQLDDIGVSRLSIEECVRGNTANGYQKAG